MDARVVFVTWSKSPVAVSDLVDRLRCALHEFREALGVIEVNEREGFVREHERGAAVYDVMDQHLALSQAIAKLLDLVRRAQREIMIGEPNAGPFFYVL